MTEQSTADRLGEERRATVARIEALTGEVEDIHAGSVGANADDEHDPEGSTIAFERARVSTLLAQGRAYLEEIERAHVRLGEGTYGTCERCGTAIPAERLAARPVARTCVECQTARA